MARLWIIIEVLRLFVKDDAHALMREAARHQYIETIIFSLPHLAGLPLATIAAAPPRRHCFRIRGARRLSASDTVHAPL